MSAELVGHGLAHQPQRIIGKPAVRCARLIQTEFLFQKIAQAIEQFALKRVFRRSEEWAFERCEEQKART